MMHKLDYHKAQTICGIDTLDIIAVSKWAHVTCSECLKLMPAALVASVKTTPEALAYLNVEIKNKIVMVFIRFINYWKITIFQKIPQLLLF